MKTLIVCLLFLVLGCCALAMAEDVETLICAVMPFNDGVKVVCLVPKEPIQFPVEAVEGGFVGFMTPFEPEHCAYKNDGDIVEFDCEQLPKKIDNMKKGIKERNS